MRNSIKNNRQVTHDGVLKHSQIGTNTPTQPTVPKMPPVKPNKDAGKK